MSETKTLQQYTRILENLNDAVLYFDQSNKLAYINAAGEMLLEISARQVLGQPVDNVLHCLKGPLKQELERSLTSGVSLTERNLKLVLTGNHCVSVDCSITPIYEGDKPDAILIALQQLDHHLRISREEQQASQQNVARLLVRGLAHEIKNPLGGIRGAAQLLEKELESDELKEYTQIIIEEADRLKLLMDSMLGPNKRPQVKKLNIHSILEKVRQLVQIELPEEIEIIRDYDPSIPDLYADQDQLIQAFLNIVRNAAQALVDRGEIKLKTRIERQVTLGNRQSRLAAKVDVIDNGPGVDESMKEQIFYPMITGRPEGTGLGLSIAQSIISRCGGLIEFKSEPGSTIFSIYLPLENGHD